MPNVGYGLSQGDIFSVTVKQRLFEQTVLNIQHYFVQGADATQDASAFWNEMADALYAIAGQPNWCWWLRSAQSVNVVHRELVFQKLYPTRYTAYTVERNLTGLVQSTTPAANLGGTVTKRSVLATRSGRGSMHIAGIPEEGFENGMLAPSAFNKLQGLADNLPKIFTVEEEAATFLPIIWSPATQTQPLRIVQSCVAQTEARVMRRRTVGLGI